MKKVILLIIAFALIIPFFCEVDTQGFHLTASGRDNLETALLLIALGVGAACLDKRRKRKSEEG
jgi:hypothetical protein